MNRSLFIAVLFGDFEVQNNELFFAQNYFFLLLSGVNLCVNIRVNCLLIYIFAECYEKYEL